MMKLLFLPIAVLMTGMISITARVKVSFELN